MRVTFSEDAWDEYISLSIEDKNILKRINDLIKSIQRDGFMKEIGKPEALRHEKGYSRRIDDKTGLFMKSKVIKI